MSDAACGCDTYFGILCDRHAMTHTDPAASRSGQAELKPCLCGGEKCIGEAQLLAGYACVYRAGLRALSAPCGACAEKDQLLHLLTSSKAPCGHWACYSHTEDGGKRIACWQCRAEAAESALSAIRAELETERRRGTSES